MSEIPPICAELAPAIMRVRKGIGTIDEWSLKAEIHRSRFEAGRRRTIPLVSRKDITIEAGDEDLAFGKACRDILRLELQRTIATECQDLLPLEEAHRDIGVLRLGRPERRGKPVDGDIGDA